LAGISLLMICNTDGTSWRRLPKHERKKHQIESASGKTDRAKVLKLADKTSNLGALVFSPAPDWSIRRMIEYIEWAREVVEGLRGANASLEKEFDDAARAAEQSLVPTV
jgi:GTP diphosphokinase / guanosine-3',5'-bis(diphosphate) 3'-diphosphatase